MNCAPVVQSPPPPAHSRQGGPHKRAHAGGGRPPPSYEHSAGAVLPPPYLAVSAPQPIIAGPMMNAPPLPPPPPPPSLPTAQMAANLSRASQRHTGVAPPPPLMGVGWSSLAPPPPPPPPAYQGTSGVMRMPPEYPGVVSGSGASNGKRAARRGKPIHQDVVATTAAPPSVPSPKQLDKASDKNATSRRRLKAAGKHTAATTTEPVAGADVPQQPAGVTSEKDTITRDSPASTYPPSSTANTTASVMSESVLRASSHSSPLGIAPRIAPVTQQRSSAHPVQAFDPNAHSHLSSSIGAHASSLRSLDESGSGSFRRGVGTESPPPSGAWSTSFSGVWTRSGDLGMAPHASPITRASPSSSASATAKKTMTHKPYSTVALDQESSGRFEMGLGALPDTAACPGQAPPQALSQGSSGTCYGSPRGTIATVAVHGFSAVHTTGSGTGSSLAASRASPFPAASMCSPTASPPRASVHQPYRGADTYAAEDGGDVHVHVIERRSTHITSPVSQGPKVFTQSPPSLAASMASVQLPSRPASVTTGMLASLPYSLAQPVHAQPKQQAADGDAIVPKTRVTNNPYTPVLGMPVSSNATGSENNVACTAVVGGQGRHAHPTQSTLRLVPGHAPNAPAGQGWTAPSSMVTSNATSSGVPSPAFPPGVAPPALHVTQSPLPQPQQPSAPPLSWSVPQPASTAFSRPPAYGGRPPRV